jgi:hypothetical protein
MRSKNKGWEYIPSLPQNIVGKGFPFPDCVKFVVLPETGDPLSTYKTQKPGRKICVPYKKNVLDSKISK